MLFADQSKLLWRSRSRGKSPPSADRALKKPGGALDRVPAQGERASDLGHMPPLVACDPELVLAWLSRSICPSQGRCAVGRATGDLLHLHQALLRVWDANDDQSVVQQSRMEAGDRRLLATVLGGGGGEDAPYFAHERSLCPEIPGSVQEVTHLPCHISEARRRAEDDRIRFRQLIWMGDRDMSKRGTGLVSSGTLQGALRHHLRHLVERHLRAGDFTRTRCHRFGHLVDVAVHAVEDHLHMSRHVLTPL
jgi:hypothetical protein